MTYSNMALYAAVTIAIAPLAICAFLVAVAFWVALWVCIFNLYHDLRVEFAQRKEKNWVEKESSWLFSKDRRDG